MFKITLDTDKGDLKRVKKMPQAFHDGLITGVREAMFIVERTAKERMGDPGEIGVRSGNLRRSINTKVEERGNKVIGSIGSAVVYARIHELGGVIKPKTEDYLRFKVDGHWVSKKKVTIPARPYLRPSVEENMKKIKDRIVNSIQKEIDNVR